MHTFFINTSNKVLSGYDVLFDIYRENKTFVCMDCPISDWYDEDKGYLSCVKQMSEMIDGYVELNNAYNLIIYVDLPENKVYSSIPRDEYHDDDRDECSRAMHILYTHIIGNSIIYELSNSGRKPQDVLIMFGEEKHFVDLKTMTTDDANNQMIMKRTLSFLGIPEDDAVMKIAKEIDDGDHADKVAAFKERIAPFYKEEILSGVRKKYDQDIDLWCDEIVNEGKIEAANASLYKRICKIYKNESDRIGINILSCPYDCYASKVNKCVLAQTELNISLHLIKCVEMESVFTEKDTKAKKTLIPFHKYAVDEIAAILKVKMDIFVDKKEETETLSESFDALKLTPALHVFDHEKFGLDEFGTVKTEFEIDDVENEDAEPCDDDAGEEEDNTILIKGNDKEMREVKKEGRPLFTSDEYKAFDYNFTEGRDQMFKKNTTPEQYIARAQKVRRHHLDYLKKLNHHVLGVMSNYAAKSKQNVPALLRMGQYRYAVPGSEGKEKRVLDTLESVADTSYKTVLNQYMDFCAGRTVAISDIEQQCNWFISRVHQIKESLRKLKLVAFGLLIAILVLYLPFFVIQFDAIVKNVLTLTTALCSIAIPVVLLYFIFTVLALRQKKRYVEAWKEFEERSARALEMNRIAVEKYDRLLSTVIPALRFVYEYKLDVTYYAECYKVAEAKIEHHKRKLRERSDALANILSDLEFRFEDEQTARATHSEMKNTVDYSVSFCSGKKNRAFYSVIDRGILSLNNESKEA